ncbi:hypothetical protein H0H81_004998 [Sphagnurus paluster]|uniref:Uncharacterized protein n=1 Tax=Sphagnurus paluster TaxID=117069 RepID=A0A9P7KJW4_9AGAR|nr:hypothetical protein H0H81_004998 [Sphagnurus paluster]
MPRPPRQSDRHHPAHIPHPHTIFPLKTAEAAGVKTLVAKIKGVQTKKKYKPVAQKVRSVVASCPDDFRIERKIIGDPLASMPKLDPNPVPYRPQGRYTEERMLQLDHEHPGFLTEAERRIMHDLILEPLNCVTIQHSGVTLLPDHVAKQFAGKICGAMLDLFVGYDERLLAPESRDLITFQMPFGPEIPEKTIPYIDDVLIKGPDDWHIVPETSLPVKHPANPGVRLAIWEFFQDMNRILQRMKYCG